MNVSLCSIFVFCFFTLFVSEEQLQDLNRFVPAGGLFAMNTSCNLPPATDTLVCSFRNAKTPVPSKTRRVHHIPGSIPCSVCSAAIWPARLVPEGTAVWSFTGREWETEFQDDAPLPMLAAFHLHHVTCWTSVVPLLSWLDSSHLWPLQFRPNSSANGSCYGQEIRTLALFSMGCIVFVKTTYTFLQNLTAAALKAEQKGLRPHPDISQDSF